MTQEYHELRKQDVGRRSIGAFGRAWLVESFLPYETIGQDDIGKRLTMGEDGPQVETDEQRAARLALTHGWMIRYRWYRRDDKEDRTDHGLDAPTAAAALAAWLAEYSTEGDASAESSTASSDLLHLDEGADLYGGLSLRAIAARFTAPQSTELPQQELSFWTDDETILRILGGCVEPEDSRVCECCEGSGRRPNTASRIPGRSISREQAR